MRERVKRGGNDTSYDSILVFDGRVWRKGFSRERRVRSFGIETYRGYRGRRKSKERHDAHRSPLVARPAANSIPYADTIYLKQRKKSISPLITLSYIQPRIKQNYPSPSRPVLFLFFPPFFFFFFSLFLPFSLLRIQGRTSTRSRDRRDQRSGYIRSRICIVSMWTISETSRITSPRVV